MLAVNLGGEGEVSDVINQQGPWALTPNWRSSRAGKTLHHLANDGHVFLIGLNITLPFPDDTVDLIYTNSVPIDLNSLLGPGVQSSEVRRILRLGGQWIRDGVLEWTKA
ncbi:MAG: hypothetical protein JWO38_6316 [Gemmataceae bacterium]|nr:hypothetical protein [Gemmataceae bacterium]